MSAATSFPDLALLASIPDEVIAAELKSRRDARRIARQAAHDAQAREEEEEPTQTRGCRSLPLDLRARADCTEGGAYAARPCPFEACRYNLAPDHGRRASDNSETCALDVADRGGSTLEEVGDALGVTRERVRQIEAIALGKVARAIRRGAPVEMPDDALDLLKKPEPTPNRKHRVPT